MKLHKDGTLEGTPQEIAEYNRLTKELVPPFRPWNDPFKTIGTGMPLMPNPIQPTITCDKTKSIVDMQLETQKSMNPAERPIARL